VIALSTPLHAVAMAHQLRGLGKHYSYPAKHKEICDMSQLKNKIQVKFKSTFKIKMLQTSGSLRKKGCIRLRKKLATKKGLGETCVGIVGRAFCYAAIHVSHRFPLG
jgi:hypothetical protein